MNALSVPNRWTLLGTRDTCGREAADERGSMAPRLTEAELEQAVAASLPAMTRLACRVAGNHEVAEEAVQDALLKVARSWKGFRGEAALETWFCRIVIHSVRDRIAKQRRTVGLGEANEAVASHESGPMQQALRAEQGDRVRAAVAQLPDRQREVLSLVTWEAMKPKDVADLLEISVQNVNANLYEARKQLKAMLAGELESQ